MRERQPIANADDFPNKDIRITEQFLTEHESVLVFVAVTVLHAALERRGTVDSDVREALDALIRTYRTLESGLYYESRPDNPLASNIYREVQQGLDEYQKRESQSGGLSTLRNAEILGVLAFLQRLEIQHNNGRPKGRAFIDFLRLYFPKRAEEPLLL
ncbi:MAG: hypothetical protein ACRD7E_10675 [Bryobacteraceae bacterium]